MEDRGELVIVRSLAWGDTGRGIRHRVPTCGEKKEHVPLTCSSQLRRWLHRKGRARPAFDGCTEGRAVGCLVGCIEGRAVGCRVGLPVGCPVGCFVGLPDGAVLGRLEGCAEGCREGWPVGQALGNDIGWPVGSPVGFGAEAAGLGDWVGALTGGSLEALVGGGVGVGVGRSSEGTGEGTDVGATICGVEDKPFCNQNTPRSNRWRPNARIVDFGYRGFSALFRQKAGAKRFEGSEADEMLQDKALLQCLYITAALLHRALLCVCD